jgi:hypothetical protein
MLAFSTPRHLSTKQTLIWAVEETSVGDLDLNPQEGKKGPHKKVSEKYIGYFEFFNIKN